MRRIGRIGWIRLPKICAVWLIEIRSGFDFVSRDKCQSFLRKEIVRLEIYLYISLSKFDRIEIMKEWGEDMEKKWNGISRPRTAKA